MFRRSLFRSSVFAAALTLCAPVHALPQPACEPLGRAGTLNGLFFGDFNGRFGIVQGRLAAQGNIDLVNYSVATSLPPGFDGDALIAGGDIAIREGRIVAGNIVASGGVAGIDEVVVDALGPGQSIRAQVPTTFGFVRMRREMAALSFALSRLPSTGSWQSRLGIMALRGDGFSALQVFALPGDRAFDAISLDVHNIPDDATIIINIDGVDAGLRNLAQPTLGVQRGRTLFNFHEARRLTLFNVAVQGTILAPGAVITPARGEVNGHVVAHSWTGSMKLRDVPFVSCALPAMYWAPHAGR